MTTYNKTTLKTFFENGDIPTGQNYSDFIDSQVNLVDTEEQDMAGNLYTPKLITAKISALNANFTGVVSAATLNGNAIMGTTGSFSSTVSANALNVATDVSAAQGTVYASAIRTTSGVFKTVAIISAAGTTQATAALITGQINRLQGVTDGSLTGFILGSPQIGLTGVMLINETAASANLWPAVGCAINGNTANTVFGMLAHTTYEVVHTYVSGYGVK